MALKCAKCYLNCVKKAIFSEKSKKFLAAGSFASIPQWPYVAYLNYGIRTRALKTRALKDTSPKNTIPNGHES